MTRSVDSEQNASKVPERDEYEEQDNRRVLMNNGEPNVNRI